MADDNNIEPLPKLTAKQEMFVSYYFLYGCNATKAAKAAGYGEEYAHSQGSRLTKNVKVDAHIRARMTEIAMSADEVLRQLAEIGRADFDDVTDENGNLDLKKAREGGTSRLIKRVKRRSITTEESDISEEEIEMHDRLKALELIGKHHKLFTDRTEISGVDGGAIEVKAVDYRTVLSALAPNDDE